MKQICRKRKEKVDFTAESEVLTRTLESIWSVINENSAVATF